MNDQDMDKLLEQGFSGNPPGQLFQARVLRDSTAALVHARRHRVRWRLAPLSAAAAFIAAASFLLGRSSMGPLSPPPSVPLVVARADDTVAVPQELVAWLEAAQLFRQLGMEDRMGRAVERARRLLPADTVIADGPTLRLVAAAESIEDREERVQPMGMPGPNPSVHSLDQILAQVFGD